MNYFFCEESGSEKAKRKFLKTEGITADHVVFDCFRKVRITMLPKPKPSNG